MSSGYEQVTINIWRSGRKWWSISEQETNKNFHPKAVPRKDEREKGKREREGGGGGGKESLTGYCHRICTLPAVMRRRCQMAGYSSEVHCLKFLNNWKQTHTHTHTHTHQAHCCFRFNAAKRKEDYSYKISMDSFNQSILNRLYFKTGVSSR